MAVVTLELAASVTEHVSGEVPNTCLWFFRLQIDPEVDVRH
jgi:hypothetical protein